MHPFVDVLWLIALASVGALLGFGCLRVPRHYWTIGFFAAAVAVGLFTACGQFPGVQFLLPISSLFEGQVPLAMIGFVAAMILATLAPRGSRRQTIGHALQSRS